MPQTDSPLRYPGGKSQLAPFVIDLLRANELYYGHYAEPFAGGAGIAWRLLLNDYVSHVHINDIDPAIFAFWHSVLNRTDELCERIERRSVTVAQWHRQKAVQRDRGAPRLDLAYSTFFLNRTNRSGILDGGVIGGFDQEGEYKVDCRFNKEELIRRIQRIGAQRERVSLYGMDAREFLKTKLLKAPPEKTLVNVDPPYYNKGRELYQSHYKPADHATLATQVGKIKHRWIVTYDDTPQTRALYAKYPSYGNELYYSAEVKRVGVELLVVDPRLTLPSGPQFSKARNVMRRRRLATELIVTNAP